MVRGSESFLSPIELEYGVDGALIERVPVDNPRFASDASWSEYEDFVLGVERPVLGNLDNVTIGLLIRKGELGDMTQREWELLEANRPDLFTSVEEARNA